MKKSIQMAGGYKQNFTNKKLRKAIKETAKEIKLKPTYKKQLEGKLVKLRKRLVSRPTYVAAPDVWHAPEEIMTPRIDKLESDLREYLKEMNLAILKREDCGSLMVRMTPAEMVDASIKYLRECVAKRERPTVGMWCINIGIPIHTIMRWQSVNNPAGIKASEYYAYPITMVKSFISSVYEAEGTAKVNPVFNIFMLKNLGMEDKHVVESAMDKAFDPDRREKIRQRLREMITE